MEWKWIQFFNQWMQDLGQHPLSLASSPNIELWFEHYHISDLEERNFFLQKWEIEKKNYRSSLENQQKAVDSILSNFWNRKRQEHPCRMKVELSPEEEEEGGFECCICSHVSIDEDSPLDSFKLPCGHSCCQQCLSSFLNEEYDAHHFPFQCPSKCGKEIPLSVLSKLLPPPKLEKYQLLSVSPDLKCCPTSGCDYVFSWNIHDDPHFRCEKCQKHFCLVCQVDYHYGMSCVNFQQWNSNYFKVHGIYQSFC